MTWSQYESLTGIIKSLKTQVQNMDSTMCAYPHVFVIFRKAFSLEPSERRILNTGVRVTSSRPNVVEKFY